MERELWQLSAVTLAAMIRDREVSSLEVVDAHLVRIDAVNARVNAVVEVRPDEVRAEARSADRAVHDGAALGALHGVPFTVKTNIDVAGYATTEGTVALRDVVADTDAPQVEHMRRAGAIVLARTNMPDLGLRVNTESSLYGATHNPWRRGVTAGGSSGGEACAIATGMSPMGLGNDLGGSLRNPAFACGIASIKPSRGRVPQGNRTAPFAPGLHNQTMSVEGVLARHVGDVRAGLEALKGSHPYDPQAHDAPLEGPPLARRCALVPEPFGGETHPDIAEGVRVAGRALAAAGYEVVEVEPPQVFESYLAWTDLLVSNMSGRGPVPRDPAGRGRAAVPRPHDGRVPAVDGRVEVPDAPDPLRHRPGVERVHGGLPDHRGAHVDPAAVRPRVRHRRRRDRDEGRRDLPLRAAGQRAGTARGVRAHRRGQRAAHRRADHRHALSRGPLPGRGRGRGARRGGTDPIDPRE